MDSPNHIALNGEMILQRALLGLAVQPVVVLDVGAHFGEWSRSLIAAAAGRPVDVHIFEPSTFTYAELERQMSAVKHVTLNRTALSETAGEATLRVVHEGAGSNSLVPFTAHAELREQSTETVPVTTVDAYCASRGIEHVTLLKTDAEGHDLNVLRGASQLLHRGSIDCLQFEYNHRWIDSRLFLADAFEFLQPLDYQLGKVTPRGIEFYPGWSPDLESFIEGNYIACRPALAQLLPSVPPWKS